MPDAPALVLVDDDAPYNALMQQLLANGLGCPVHAFLRPTEALDAIASIGPAVVVTDFSMPEINGFSLIRQAAGKSPGTSFILISGNDLSNEQDTMSRLPGLKAFLPKPFAWRKLAEEILRVWPGDRPPPRGGTLASG